MATVTVTAYKVYKRGSTNFDVGQILKVYGAPPAWLDGVAAPTNDPLPPQCFEIDAAAEQREEAEAAATWAASNKPDRQITSEELQKKIPAFRDPHQFALAVTQEGFPKPGKKEHWFNRGGPVEDVWSERTVDRWIADTRARRDRFDTFLQGVKG
jgi:hypothetical protein